MLAAVLVAASLLSDQGTPDPNSTIMLDGTTVTVAQLKVLNDAFESSKTSSAIEISFESKAQSSMPSYDPLWHYAGSSIKTSGVIYSDVWISKAVTSTHQGVVYMAAGILMAIMDSGFGGTFWKSFYDAEGRKDATDLGQTANPLYHREAVALKIASAMYPQ